ncbi:MAG: spore coat protein U domain-containing protein [Deltaproteobacteria bacterium]|nr:spore coat protein U domain-containing protein [Deltaproteobacteria bacterium]
MKRIFIGLAALALIFAPVTSAMAATDTGSMTVSATVIGNAKITSVGNVSFGNYDPTESTTPLDANGSVAVRATKSLPYTIYVGATRTMSDGTNTLNYQLYSDAARTSAWGSTLATGQAYPCRQLQRHGYHHPGVLDSALHPKGEPMAPPFFFLSGEPITMTLVASTRARANRAFSGAPTVNLC